MQRAVCVKFWAWSYSAHKDNEDERAQLRSV